MRERFKEHMRLAVLEAAHDLTVDRGWDRVRMGQVADRAGVSRAALYKEFGDKAGLGEAVVLREASRFLEGIRGALEAHIGDAKRGIAAAVDYTLNEAGRSPLLKAVLISNRDLDAGGQASTGMLPLLTTSAPLLDLASDKDARTNEVGELVLRGPNVFAGYWGLPEATAEAFRGGWFHTGDLGRIDAEGFITLVDRKKDMIITGGENVYPIEVEQVLYRHPAVREVAVVGVPDVRWGETPVATVALQDGAEPTGEELIAYTRERLAHFKCPTRIEFVAELPRTATGKVLKTVLRQQHGGNEHAVRR